MTSAPPAALLRLRQGDVVRLCGFASATQGLDLVERHAVTAGRRDGSRLEAHVADDPPCEVSVELPGDGAEEELRWRCSTHGHTMGESGCAHIAALLTAWVRAPSDFPPTTSNTPETPSRVPVPSETSPPPTAQISQPRLIDSPRPARIRGDTLADELERLPSGELLAMTRRVMGEDLALHEARDALAAKLSDPAALSALLDRLDPAPRALYAALQLIGGAITAGDLDTMAARAGEPSARLRAEMAVLARHGLVFPASGHRCSAPHESAHPPEKPRESARGLTGWRIPPELRATLRPRLPLDALPSRPPNGPPVWAESATSARNTLRVEPGSPRPLLLALALLARAPAPLGPLSGKDIRSPTSAPPAGLCPPGELPPGRLAALSHAAGLHPAVAALARRVLLLAHDAAPAQPVTDLACVPSKERLFALRTAFRLWREAEVAFELTDFDATDSPLRAHFDATSPAFSREGVAREVAMARRFIVRLLSVAQPGAWYALEHFVDLVWRLDPFFLRGRQQTYTAPAWWLERADGERRPLRPSVRDEWQAGEGEYLSQLLTATLHTWGILDLARDVAGQPVALRITPLGAWLLVDPRMEPEMDVAPAEVTTALAGEWGPPVLPTRAGDLAVQPLAAGALLLDALDTWARVTGLAGGRLLYALDADLAAAAMDRGASPGELPERMRAANPQAGARVAELVARRLEEWRAAYGGSRIDEGWALLEARDEATLVEALALVPALAARCRKLDDCHALISPADLPSLQAALARRGIRL